MILLGEMRDLETISTALTAAETGHLVFATLHTQSAPSTIDRIIDVFPAAQQDQVRMQLANSLQGIVTQTLLPRADGTGRVCALEILFLDDAIRNLIRQGKIEQVYSYMQTGTRRGHADDGAVARRARPEAHVTVPDALGRSSRPEALVSALERAGIPVPALSTDGAPAARRVSAPACGWPGASCHVFLGRPLRQSPERECDAVNEPADPETTAMRRTGIRLLQMARGAASCSRTPPSSRQPSDLGRSHTRGA